jgi:hypothetical protein
MPARKKKLPSVESNKGTSAKQPTPEEQSGSAGRVTAPDKLDESKDSGQGHYGQSGFAGSDEKTRARKNK